MKKNLIIICFLLTIFSFGLVLHPEGDIPALSLDHPPDSVMAHVGSSSGVVIHPQYILTAKHINVYLNTIIYVDGEIYYPEIIYNNIWNDITLIKVQDANFVNFVSIAQTDYEENDIMVLGGFGLSRGNTIYADYDPNLVVGYEWGSSSGILLWGTNRIYKSNLYYLYIDFDDPYDTICEAGTALYDSGCGGFCFVDNQWWTVGIGTSVTDYGYDYFLPYSFPDPYFSKTRDRFVRICNLRGWIESIIYNADMNKDENIDIEDLVLFVGDWLIESPESYPFNYYEMHHSRSDLNRDGKVNLIDFAIFAEEWRNSL